MRRYIGISGLAVCGLIVALSAAPAEAQPLGKDDLKCRKGIVKGFSKTLKAGDKITSGCHKNRNGGDPTLLATDCNNLGHVCQGGPNNGDYCHTTGDCGGSPCVAEANSADTGDKFRKAQEKLRSGVNKSCTQAGAGPAILEQYVSCPEPCRTDTGVAAGAANRLADYDELAECLACVAESELEAKNAAVLGMPTPGDLNGDEQKCHGSIAKNYGKYLSTIFKERTKCQNTEEKKNGKRMLSQTDCATTDAGGKVSGALTKAAGKLDDDCNVGSVNLPDIMSCDTAFPGIVNCLADEHNDAGGILLPAHYQLVTDGTACPVRADTLIRAGKGECCTTNADCDNGGTCGGPIGTGHCAPAEGRCTTASFLDIGWTGVAHDFDIPDNYLLSSDISGCQNAAAPCGDCTLAGVSASGPQYASFTRCDKDLAIPCSTPFQKDPSCPLDSGNQTKCVYVLGPPLPVSAGNNPVCSVNKLFKDVSGTVNPDTGAAEFSVTLATDVHLGTLTKPCPRCVGDVTPHDGAKNGLCDGGLHDGEPCDAHAFDGTFARKELGHALSLDCQPNNLLAPGNFIPIEFTTGTSTLPFEAPCTPPGQFFDCPCAVCNLNTDTPCANDSDCSGTCTDTTGFCDQGFCSNSPLNACTTDGDCLGCSNDFRELCSSNGDCSFGVCTSDGAGAPRVAPGNACSDTVCVDQGGDKGACTSSGSPEDDFCDGMVKANGDGYLTCLNQAACTAIANECDGGDCGLCGGLSKVRPCHLDPIVANGVPGPAADCSQNSDCAQNLCGPKPCATNGDCNGNCAGSFCDSDVCLADPLNPRLASTFCVPPTGTGSVDLASGLPGPVRVESDMVTSVVY